MIRQREKYNMFSGFVSSVKAEIGEKESFFWRVFLLKLTEDFFSENYNQLLNNGWKNYERRKHGRRI